MTQPISLQEFIHHIPKAELHLHIEGTLEPELMFSLAKRNHIQLEFSNVQEIHQAYHFKDLQSFLDIYYAATKVLVHEEDFYELTINYLRRAAQQNVRHAEIFFDPQSHTNRGVEFKTVVTGIYRALEEGERELNISSKLIMCFLRDLSADAAQLTLEQALPYKDWIIGIGLDSAEIGNPPKKFQHVYAQAKEFGFLTCAHAGEEGPSEYIWEALDILQVKRIDHGVKCMQDPNLIHHLAQLQIPLTVCPLSNVKLAIYKTMEQHPLKKMLLAGLCVLVNSDDPAYFGGYVEENFIAVATALSLNQDEIYKLAQNSFLATFLNDQRKQKLIDELDSFNKRVYINQDNNL